MYVLYNIHEIVLLIKIMRKLYQILYNVGRLTDAPGRRAFSFPGGGHLGSGLFSFPGGHFGVGRFARGKGTQSYEARFSPSRSPFPGTSLFCVVVCYNVLENACMLLYWPCTAVPMGIHRTEGGLHSRPVPGNCYIAGAHLLLPVVVFLVLTCFCLLAYCWCLPASACWRIADVYLLLPVGVSLA